VESAITSGAHRLRTRIGVLALASIAALALAELALRVYARATGRERGLTEHAEFGWAYLPDIEKSGEWWSASVPARTNSRGWRDAETPLERAPAVRRIVVLGDSFTFGMTVDYGDRFTEVLEREISALDVVNLGLNAAGTDQELRILEVEGLRYRPDVVVLVAFLGNDLADISYDRKNFFGTPWYRLEGGNLELVPPRQDWLVHARCASYLVEALLRPFDRMALATTVAPPWKGRDTAPLFAALVARIGARATESGAKFLAALVYAKTTATAGIPESQERARAEARATGVALLDTFEDFAEPTRRGVELYSADGHWNPAGHALFARALEAEIARRGWLP
jgi:lysophospholipase L1-like esterase